MRLNITDLFFLSLRMTIAATLFYNLGFLYGFLSCCALNLLNFYVMKLCFGMEALAAVDELFILDDEKNVANIVSKY
jgi:hypothetical protein